MAVKETRNVSVDIDVLSEVYENVNKKNERFMDETDVLNNAYRNTEYQELNSNESWCGQASGIFWDKTKTLLDSSAYYYSEMQLTLKELQSAVDNYSKYLKDNSDEIEKGIITGTALHNLTQLVDRSNSLSNSGYQAPKDTKTNYSNSDNNLDNVTRGYMPGITGDGNNTNGTVNATAGANTTTIKPSNDSTIPTPIEGAKTYSSTSNGGFTTEYNPETGMLTITYSNGYHREEMLGTGGVLTTNAEGSAVVLLNNGSDVYCVDHSTGSISSVTGLNAAYSEQMAKSEGISYANFVTKGMMGHLDAGTMIREVNVKFPDGSCGFGFQTSTDGKTWTNLGAEGYDLSGATIEVKNCPTDVSSCADGNCETATIVGDCVGGNCNNIVQSPCADGNCETATIVGDCVGGNCNNVVQSPCADGNCNQMSINTTSEVISEPKVEISEPVSMPAEVVETPIVETTTTPEPDIIRADKHMHMDE